MRFITVFLLFSLHFSLYAQNMGIKLTAGTSPNTTLDVNGSTAYREGAALNLTAAVNSDVALGAFSFFRITGATTAFSITGFANGVDGRVLTLINATSQKLTLTHQATSAAANQINTGGANLTLAANGVVTLIYNTNLTNWVVIGGQGFINNWGLTGNAGTVDGTNFIGTTDNIPLSIRVNNQKAGRIDHLNFNAFYGYMAGNANTGTHNSFFGHQAGSTNTTGKDLVGLGYGALGVNTLGDNNVAVGSGALVSNTTGYDNVAIGRYSMRKNITSYRNTAVGTYSLQENLAGYYNTALGVSALNQNTSGFYNVATGVDALLTNTTGNNNVAYGTEALYFNNLGNNNTAIGTGSLYANTSGNNNTALGMYSLGGNLTAWGNTALGYRSAFSNTTGQGMVAIGDSALHNNTTGTGNIAIGYQAGLINTTGGNNTFLGYQANGSIGTLTNATAIGANAAVGASNSLVLGGTGANSVYVGIGTTTPGAALHVSSNLAGLYNDILLSGYHNNDVPIFNIRRARGTDAAPANLVNGDGLGGNHYWGYVNGGWNYLSGVQGNYRGNGTTVLSTLEFLTSNSVRMTLDENGGLAIGTGTATAGFKLSVNGSADKAGGGSWAVFSDSRLKRNVRQFTEGLATLEKINPVWFQYNSKSGYADTAKTYVGVIAQDIEKVAPYMVEKTKTASFDDQRIYDANALNYILVNSVKELKAENDRLKAENTVLKAAVEKNSKDIEGIKAMLEKKQN